MAEPSLGLIMILRDEAANLPRSLAPVADCFDEVVVVDTGSQDQTPRLARQMGARVYDFTWCHDFAAARNYSIEKAKADWLFWLDGDNAISPQQVQALRGVIPSQGPAIVWARELVEVSGDLLWQKRCFPRRSGVRFRGRVHEQLIHPPDWPQVASPVVVRHWGYQDAGEVKEKGRYYLSLLEQMLQDSPDDFYARFQAARCCLNLRDFDRARRYLQQVARDSEARRLNPQLWIQSQVILAQLLENQGQTEKAAKVLDELLAAEPRQGLAHHHRGRLAFLQGDFARAENYLRQAERWGLGQPFLDMNPDAVLFRNRHFRAKALEKLAKDEQALALYREALALKPENVAVRADLALLLLRLGRGEEARQEAEHILSIRPQDRRAKEILARCREAA